jgi:SOS response regulatory protein OraA/RecX
VAEALSRLADEGLVDDVGAARSIVRGRGARYGTARIERELKSRGFARDAIAAALTQEEAGAREGEALRRAFDRLWKARAHLAPALRRRRVFDALTRRGFSPERISDIIKGHHAID